MIGFKILEFLGCRDTLYTVTLYTTVYWTPTYTHEYLDFESNRPLPTRICVGRTLFDRTSYIVKDQEQLHIEGNSIKTTLKRCRYKSWAFNQALGLHLKSSNRPINQGKPHRGYVSVPYIQVISEPFKRLLSSSTDCLIPFKGSYTIRDHLVHPKIRMKLGVAQM